MKKSILKFIKSIKELLKGILEAKAASNAIHHLNGRR